MAARNRIVWKGLEEFEEALRNLPEHLTEDAQGIVSRHVRRAETQVKQNYQAHAHTGKLAASVKVDWIETNQFGAGARLKATAYHAHLFEYGTAARQRGQGISTGMMPPAPPVHAFVPVVQEEGRGMTEALITLVRREGFKVQGDAR